MLEVISDFLKNHPRKNPLDKGMKQGLGSLNLDNLESQLAAGEITQDEYDAGLLLREEAKKKGEQS